MTHRLIKKIASSEMQGKENEVLESYETDKNGVPDWLEFGEDADGDARGAAATKLNFPRQLDYMNARNKEVNEILSSGSKQFANSPTVEDIQIIVRNVAIRVVKTMTGTIDGVTSNRKRGKNNSKLSADGSILGKSKKVSTRYRYSYKSMIRLFLPISYRTQYFHYTNIYYTISIVENRSGGRTRFNRRLIWTHQRPHLIRHPLLLQTQGVMVCILK